MIAPLRCPSHDERDDDKLAIASDEAADDEKQVKAIDKGTGPDMGGTGATETPGEQAAGYV